MSGLLNYLKPISNLSIITRTARAALWPSLWQLLANYRLFSEREETKKEYFFLSHSLFNFLRSLLSSLLPPKLTVLNTRIVAADLGNWHKV